MTSLSATIDVIDSRIIVFERIKRATKKVTTLKVTIDALKSDVYRLKCFDMSMIFGTVDFPNVHVDPDISPATTGYDVQVEKTIDPECEVEPYEYMF